MAPSLAQWLKSNRAAATHVKKWLRSRTASSSYRELATQLRTEFDCPFTNSDALGRSLNRIYPDECAAPRQNAKADPEAPELSPLEQHEAKSASAKIRAQQAAVIKDLEKRCSTFERLFEGVHSVMGDYVEPTPFIPIQPGGALPEATYIAAASDWHPGALVRSREVRGLNEFNPDIFEQRAERFFQSNLILLNAARSAWNVNQALLWLGGDLMENFLHEENRSENTMSPTEEVVLVFNTLVKGIRFILDHWDVAHLKIVTSNGNHGRNTHKMHAAGAFRDSYEFMIYTLLKQYFADEPRITWQLGLGYEHIVDIYGWKLRTHHGDALKGGGGIGGIAPALYRRIHRVNSSEHADCDLLGHFHAWGFLPRAHMNGSLVGYSAAAQRWGFPYEAPIQISWIVDAKHKMPSAMNPVFCQEPRRATTKSR